MSVTFSERNGIIFGSLLVSYPAQCSVRAVLPVANVVAILDSWMATFWVVVQIAKKIMKRATSGFYV